MRQSTSSPELWLLGDSLIAYCDWQARFPDRRLRKLGEPGETVAGLLRRADRLTVLSPPPAWLLVMSGTNDLLQEQYGFPAQYRRLVVRLRTLFPQAALCLNSLLPLRAAWLAPSAVPRCNELLREIAGQAGADFLDVYPALLAADGSPWPGLFQPDGVHLSPAGYEVWAALLADRLP